MATARTFTPIQAGLAQPKKDLTESDGTKLGFRILVGYVFLLQSRVIEFIPGMGSLRVMLLGAILLSLFAIANGGLFKAASTRIGLSLTGETIWMLFGCPFSVWVGGSINAMTNSWLKSYLIFLFVAGLLTTVKQCKSVVSALGFATVVVAIIAMKAGVSNAEGRIQAEGGSLGNSNDLAAQILLGLPFCIHMVMDKGRNFAIRMVMLAGTAGALYVAMQTGSRAAMLTIVAVGVFAFWKSSKAGKIMLITSMIGLVMAVVFLLPQDLKIRYMTAFMGDSVAESVDSQAALTKIMAANNSTEERKQLLQNALQLALHNPVFGVGFGQFAVADAARAEESAEKAHWLPVHNSFLVILTEDGVPAFVFFVSALFFGFVTTYKIHSKPGKGEQGKEVKAIAFCIMTALIAFFVCGNFSPSAYGTSFPMIAGFAVGLTESARKKAKNLEGAAPEMQQIPLTPLPARTRPIKPRALPSWRV